MREIVARASEWFGRQARALPWRQTRDPYAIWISEVMLQQTQVATVIPYYLRFLDRFPDVSTLAEAPVDRVLAAWSGLGYYSRARNLHRGACAIVASHGGAIPRDRDRLLLVPGIGPYTAGAIASIAFDLPVPLVDGNVQRVLARLHGFEGTVCTSAATRFFWEQAELWVRAAHSPRIANQALMELGATLCSRGSPRCELCPLNEVCVARAEGRAESLPRRAPRRPAVDIWWSALVVHSRGRVLLRRAQAGEWWEDLWEFPRLESTSRAAWDQQHESLVNARSGGWESLCVKKHTVTHHRLHVAVFRTANRRAPALPAGAGLRWIPVAEIPTLPLSALARKVAASAL